MPEPGEEAYRLAGLYDPHAPDAAQQLALLEYLAGLGADVGRLVGSQAEGDLVALGLDLLLEQGSLTIGELADLAGLDLDTVTEAYRLVGVEVPGPEDRVFEESELAFPLLLGVVAETFPDSATREILRAVSASLSTLSAAAIFAFVGTVEDDMRATLDPVTQAQVVRNLGVMGLDLGTALRSLFRHHLRQGIRRQRAGLRSATDRRTVRFAVGFVDLVGYTSRTASMDPGELIDFVGSFRERTNDVVTDGGGQVVKHIGDEIMFSAVDSARACGIALELIDAFAEPGASPRGGIAAGQVVARHGDLYGPVVNMASRLAETSVPGELLAPADIAADLAPDPGGGGSPVYALEPGGRRQLKGFAEPVAVVSVTRSATDPTDDLGCPCGS